MDREVCEAAHWLDLDRTEGLRLVNVLAKPAERPRLEDLRVALLGGQPAGGGGSARFADVLDSATATAPDPLTEAIKRLVAERAAGAKVTEMPLVSRDGVIMDRRSGPVTLHPSIVSVLPALRRRGDVSPVVESPFGAHVLVLLDVVAGHIASADERRAVCR